jgi:glycosyltransferase involved in cell wall biosynthesis
MTTTKPLVGKSFDVVIPTRNRPEKLRRCLAALSRAQQHSPCDVYVCDSSSAALAGQVEGVCAEFPFAHYHQHERVGLAAARNETSRVGTAPVVISIDDDVYIDERALKFLYERYVGELKPAVVAGAVDWGKGPSGPVVMRAIGYGRAGLPSEAADFFVTALILYPRALVRAAPFNENIRSSEDRFAGALWRSKNVRLVYEPSATAAHDDDHTTAWYEADHQDAHIYTNLFDALLVRRSARMAAAFEVLGFLAGAKHYVRRRSFIAFVRAWIRGHRLLIQDWRWLVALVETPLPRVVFGVDKAGLIRDPLMAPPDASVNHRARS